MGAKLSVYTILTLCLDVECIRLTAIKGQAVANLLANFPRTSDFLTPQQVIFQLPNKKFR